MPTAKFSIRTAIPADGKNLNGYIRSIFSESSSLITQAHEFRMQPMAQRLWIAKKASNPLETCLIATHEKAIIGMLDSVTDRRARIKHATTFTMSVHADWRGQGVGEALLGTFINWVSNNQHLEKIELHVHHNNLPAMELYKKVGFTVEGRRERAVKYEDGHFVDDILMAYWPNSSNVETGKADN